MERQTPALPHQPDTTRTSTEDLTETTTDNRCRPTAPTDAPPAQVRPHLSHHPHPKESKDGAGENDAVTVPRYGPDTAPLRAAGTRRGDIPRRPGSALAGPTEAPHVRAAAGAPSPAEQWNTLRPKLEGIKGTWTNQSYTGSVSRTMPDTALLGNGDVGVTSGGSTGVKSFYVSKGDFWAGNPATSPDLATYLRNLGGHLAIGGRWDDAVNATEESAELLRRLTTLHPGVHEPDLAAALTILSHALTQLGRPAEARKASQEATALDHRPPHR
ncbi:tetratricopeptide repeat protein [Streptomyces sp. NPDC059863]|uniref:tetratricopeptide repeat protein n=1 Tax=unclassified Streptomyces TaxID=2593676 RepID=UPI003648F9D5